MHPSRPRPSAPLFRLTLLVGLLGVLSAAGPAAGAPLVPGQLLVSTADGRVLQLSSRGQLLGVLDAGARTPAAGLAFDGAGRLWVALPEAGMLAGFDRSGAPVAALGPLGRPGAGPVSVVFVADGGFWVGQRDGAARRYDAAGIPVDAADAGPLAAGGTRIALSADGCTLLGAVTGGPLLRHDVCDGARRESPVGPANAAETIGDLAMLPDGDLLAATRMALLRLDPTGRPRGTYPAPMGPAPGSHAWVAVAAHPDGRTAWAATAGGDLVRLDLATGDAVAGPIALGEAAEAGVGGLAVVPREPVADVEISLIADRGAARLGEGVELTVDVTNLGPDRLLSAEIVLPAPAGISFLGDGGWPETWSVGPLAPGETASLALAARIETPGPHVVRARRASSLPADPEPANDAASAVVAGVAADLVVTAGVDVPDPGVGDPIVLTVVVENLGPDAADGVLVADPSLLGTRFDAVTPGQGTWDETTERWSVGTLAAGASATLTIDATVESFCWGNRARVIASNVPDPVAANNVGLVERAEVSYWIGADGDGVSWSDAGNWSAGVPGPSTTACVVRPGGYKVELDVDAAIRRLGFGGDGGVQTLRLTQPRTLTLAEPSYLAETVGWAWDAGTLAGAGPLVNDGVIRLRTTTHKTLAGTLVNNGTVTWSAGAWVFDDGTLENDGVLELAADATLSTAAGATGLLVDRGVATKTAGTGRTNLDVVVDLDGGTLEAATGVLALIRGGRLADGVLGAAAGAAVDLEIGTFALSGVVSGEPVGAVRMSAGAALAIEDGLLATLDVNGAGFAWEEGSIVAPGRLLNTGLVVLDTDADKVLGAILENDGTLFWDGGSFVFDDGLLQNDGLFTIVGDQQMRTAGAVSGQLFQRGELVKSSGAGETRVDVVVFLEPDSVTAVDSGTLAFPKETDHRPTSELGGDGGTLMFDSVISAGITAPGGAPGILTWVGEWRPTESGELDVELGGLTPGTGHDRLDVVGDVALAGTLRVTLIDGFVPTPGDTFTIVTCSTGCQDAFEQVVEPPGASFDVVVDANEVRLVAVEPPTGPRLQLIGICPGPMTLSIDGATPGGTLALLRGTQEGPIQVPGGACAGTELGIADPRPVTRVVADGEGRVEVPLSVPGPACGVLVQALDFTSCQPSGVEAF